MSHKSIERIAFDSSSPGLGWMERPTNLWVGGVLLIVTDHIQS
jgi:hypothetical protein